MGEVSENKRIVKNSLYLYLRMFITLIVGLYTSRITLVALGVSDYGIYNVVGGFVTMFVFLNLAMVNSTQRYITYELGKGNIKNLEECFSTSVNIHIVIALIIVLLSETIGVWFIYYKMVIPESSIDAAIWVFQFSVLSCVLGIVSTPYNALIIAHEKMSAFAFISLLDAILKLLIAFFILSSEGNRLILYAALLACVAALDRLIYGVYCRRTFPESKYHFTINKPLILEMTKFASWNLVGNLSYVCYTQGLNVLLNVFFNPVVNAARGIAVQVQSVVANFSYNIENAFKPQITKTFAQGERERMHMLIYASARFSFFVLFLISFPILIEIDQILNVWLVEVPSHTANFVRLTILASLSDALTAPLITAAQATGDVRKYQLTVSLLCFLILPLSYIALLFIPIPEMVFVINLFIFVIIQIVKVIVVSRQVGFSICNYFKIVFVKAFFVVLFSCSILFPLVSVMDQSLFRLTVVVIISVVTVTVAIYTFGISELERGFVKEKVLHFNK